MIRDYLAIACGGALGAVSRYGLTWLLPTGTGEVPWATLLANVGGAFLLGAASVRLPERSPALLFFGVGFLGSLTTFSTLAYELVSHTTPVVALGYATLTLALGPAAAWLGVTIFEESPP